MSMDVALGNAISGLANINRQLSMISQNVANVNTPDYAREVGTQTSAVAGDQGLGVITGNVQREIDLQAQRAVLSQNATVAGLATRSTALNSIDSVQGTPGAGSDLASLVGKLSNSFISLQSDPSSASSQSGVVNAAHALASQLNDLSSAYGTARQTAQDGIVSDVTSLNSSLTTLANLTQQIMQQKQLGQSTADLENLRDTAMRQTSQMVDVSFIAQPNGGMLAATKGGLVLPLQSPAPQFSVASSGTGQSAYYPGGGIGGILLNGADVTAQLAGGRIGATVTLRDIVLPTYQGELDEFANTLNNRMAGQGLQLFTQPQGGTTTLSPAPTQTGYVGYAAAIAVNPSVTAQPSLVRDGNLTIAGSTTGASAFTPNPSGGPAGFTALIARVLTYAFGPEAQSGVPQTAPATTGLGPAGTLAAPFQAPADLAGLASTIVSSQSGDVANTTSQLGVETSVQTALQARFADSSGVKTDTEMSIMIQLQNAYGANARIITALQTMWTGLLAAIPAA